MDYICMKCQRVSKGGFPDACPACGGNTWASEAVGVDKAQKEHEDFLKRTGRWVEPAIKPTTDPRVEG